MAPDDEQDPADPNSATADGWVLIDADPEHVRREREKARELRKSGWWQRRLQRGLCAYCGKPFAPKLLTMDHVVPVARGGRSVKGNVVPACKQCNNKKRLLTPAELLLEGQRVASAADLDDESGPSSTPSAQRRPR